MTTLACLVRRLLFLFTDQARANSYNGSSSDLGIFKTVFFNKYQKRLRTAIAHVSRTKQAAHLLE
jgi:hypothetical protein